MIVTTIMISAVFLIFPGIDIAVTGWFYRPGAGFTLADDRPLIILRHINDIAMISVLAAILASLAVKLGRPQRPSIIPPRAASFLVSTLLLGPGLLVNVILKNHWGRPRPFMVDLFGGDMPYVSVWRITDYCATNCSFVAGEASSAIWLTGLAMVVPRQWRLPTAAATGALAVAFSANRIVFGAHFLSDVLLSWCLTLLVMIAIHRLIYGTNAITDERLDNGLARFSNALGLGRRAA
jgi:membrane-associated PAP2 superfamily phosphatase